MRRSDRSIGRSHRFERGDEFGSPRRIESHIVVHAVNPRRTVGHSHRCHVIECRTGSLHGIMPTGNHELSDDSLGQKHCSDVRLEPVTRRLQVRRIVEPGITCIVADVEPAHANTQALETHMSNRHRRTKRARAREREPLQCQKPLARSLTSIQIPPLLSVPGSVAGV